MRLRMRSMPLMVPPTSVVVVRGTGAGSRMGSCPSVVNAPEVAELSRISVFGSAGGGGVAATAGVAVPFCRVDFCWPDGCPRSGCCAPDFDGSEPGACCISLCLGLSWAGAGVAVCCGGNPCWGLGGAGLAWAKTDAAEIATNRNANVGIGERCIEFQKRPVYPGRTPDWMQVAGTQMAGANGNSTGPTPE
jgi:hypothetical protein